ncbi:MAG: tRNA (adenosine(37)-N6)-threonylcarbamoyltransferase complex ATPase subunit type 1 TsaE [Notoacmeibacter sp.]|nr:tRNA (adenosine(37)-N6)-threonylcarbamoyltransferase complex ATPase subunit type 1 TsaE [Notoacmeibacter sp.]MCC0031626.1 tRNA (adenosine(37)-N6)-threonylcarbamoyltransferase complex ATPase subunit type 1 TsaE [Brucellaceae bacterium]
MAELDVTLMLADEAATIRLGEDLAAALKPGDVVALHGDLGAGKSTLARAAIRAMADEDGLDVPSPTFTLVQAYALRVPIAHFDLYRLGDSSELEELGFAEAASDGAVLLEWPERAGDCLPPDAIAIRLEHEGNGRRARITAQGPAAARIARSLDIRRFLDGAGWGGASRRFLTGDASARAYESLTLGGETRVLMNAPRMPDGPPIRDGLPYSRLAHLAEDVVPFVAIARVLRDAGFAAPEIFAQELDAGFLLTEHLGPPVFLDGEGAPVLERYCEAARLLAAMHARTWPSEIAVADGVTHHVPDYDRRAMQIELDLVPSWYIRYATGAAPDAAMRTAYVAAWDKVLDGLDGAETSLVLRDYHSPNIIWREDRAGLDRIGVIDFQDAMIGPAAYDVASLAQDARVTIPTDWETAILDAYCTARAAEGSFDRADFMAGYAIMAAQRNSKILGIFVRLNERDGKPAYLKHLPRIRAYVGRVIGHPALAPVQDFYASIGITPEDA